MKEIAIKAEKVCKAYFTDRPGSGALTRDFERWLARVQGKNDPYLSVEGGTQKDNVLWALRDIDFEIFRGEVVRLSGHNGAGKSTLLKILSRVTSPTSGKITITGHIISLLEAGAGFHPELTGRENIHLTGAMLGMSRSEINHQMDKIICFSALEKAIDSPVKRYSTGMYTRLAFAIASHLHSAILIIDEILAVGDRTFHEKCIEKLTSLSRDKGKTIILVNHVSESIRSLCTREIRLSNGKILCQQKEN